MKPIRTAWISDIVGSLGRSREEEVADDLPDLAETLGLELDLVVSDRGMEAIKDQKIDMLVFDYGGAANAYGNSTWNQFDAMIAWAEEHPSSLILLYSSFTSRMYGELLRSKADEVGSVNIMSLFVKNDIDSERAKAWFVGGDFTPYEYKSLPVNVTAPPIHTVDNPISIIETEKEIESITSDEIWEQAEKHTLSVEFRCPMIELPNGNKQGFSCFKDFCTYVYDDDDEETEIGMIGGGTGYVTFSYKGKEWMIKHSDLWYAFVEALEKED